MDHVSAQLDEIAKGLGSDYRLVKALGSGAAGEVYLVENLRLRRLEAVKVLKKSKTESAEAISQGRFTREVYVGGKLAHQNIVSTYFGGKLLDGRRFLT